MTLAANLLPVSTTPVANFATNFPSVVDTGGKFATGVNDTGGKFATDVKDAGGKLHWCLTISIVCFGLCVKYQWGKTEFY